MASRISSTRPPSLSTSSVLFRKDVTPPCCASGVRSRRTLSSFLTSHTSQTDPQSWRVCIYRSRTFLLSSSLTSPSGTGAPSDCANPSTRGINDSIVWRHLIVCWDSREHREWGYMKDGCTSQCFRMAERPPATDLRGGKASEDSFTIWMASLVVEYALDFQFDFFSYAALGSTM